MPEILQPNKHLNKASKKISKKQKMILIKTTVKLQYTSIKTDKPNGCVLISLSLSKTQKLQVSDSSIIMKPKELIDSSKEAQALHTQDLKFTA